MVCSYVSMYGFYKPYYCSLTSGNHTLFFIIVHVDGYTYERSAIVSWLSEGRSTSPLTNLPFPHTNLVPNKTLKQLMDSHRS